MYAYCSKVARTKGKLERTTKYNTRTNTFTKHSKCYKMGCIGPSIVVLQFGSLYKFSYDFTILTLHNFTSARERLSEPV